MTNENVWDFSDTSDLGEDLAKRLTVRVSSQTSENAVKYADLVASAGIIVNIAQIEAAAFRSFEDVPKTATIRAYLNAAHKAGLLNKPSLQSYAGLGVAVDGGAPDEETEVTQDEETSVDALLNG